MRKCTVLPCRAMRVVSRDRWCRRPSSTFWAGPRRRAAAGIRGHPLPEKPRARLRDLLLFDRAPRRCDGLRWEALIDEAYDDEPRVAVATSAGTDRTTRPVQSACLRATTSRSRSSEQIGPSSNEDPTHEATESAAQEAAETNGTRACDHHGHGGSNEDPAHEAGESPIRQVSKPEHTVSDRRLYPSSRTQRCDIVIRAPGVDSSTRAPAIV